MEANMSQNVVIFGYGPVGQATAELLSRRGQPVLVAQRNRPATLPAGATFLSCDVLDADSVRRTVAGCSQMVVAIGFAYKIAVWRKSWPLAMQNLLAASEAHGVSMVFVDNLYMYGPQRTPLREEMALTVTGGKPGVRADISRMWMAASSAGRVRVTALRAPDFYGPGVGNSHLGDIAFGALANGRRATLIAPPDTPHDFAYVPDIARAVATLLDAPDDAFGQAWHMPCAPIRTPRQILALGAQSLGLKLKLTALPLWSLPVLGLAVPMMRELAEMRFQWDRPYAVDADKFKKRFWSDVTPFEAGAAATALSFVKSSGTPRISAGAPPNQVRPAARGS
jgi:nucleoside-diphosphate-sugar epimerase